MDVLILIGSFTVACLAGMPVAYALGLAAILAALWTGIPLEAVMLKVSGGMSGFSLLAIPFFILAGAIMAVGGMAERLVNLAKVFVGFIRGGMAMVNIVASTLFGCISGSSVADTAAVGLVMIPQMIRHGYPRLFAVNVTISGSLQPLLLPPSHNMIIYSLAAGGTVSVAQLFMGGIIPALLLGLSLIALVLVLAHRENFPKGEIVPPRQALKIAVDAIWGLITIVIILGGILSGIFTDRVGGGSVRLCLLRHHVRLPRLQMERVAATDRTRRAHGRHGHDHDRLLNRLRLHDGAHADTGQGDGILRGGLERQVHLPALRQRAAAVARDVHGSGADAADLHPDLPARDQNFRHRPRAFRHRDDPQSRHRAAHAAGRSDHGGGMRDRPRQHGSGVAQHPGLLHSHAGRARARYLCARTVAVAVTVAVEVTKNGEAMNRGCYSE